jgi:hypothetical protein
MMDSVQLWLATPDAAQHFDPAQLTDEERDRMARLRRESRRQDFAVSRALRAQARDAAPIAASESMTHSGGYAALARAHPAKRLGVDLELHRAGRRLEVASAVFTKSEMRALEAAPAPEREHLFYAIWTIKEALAKVLVDGPQWQVRAPMADAGGVVLYQPRADLTLAVAWIGATLPIETWSWPPQRPASWPLIAAISL